MAEAEPGLNVVGDGPLQALAGFLVGDWIGEGQGDTFTYIEEATFAWAMDGRALAYRSRAYAPDLDFKHCEEGHLMYADREERLLGMFAYGDGLLELAEAEAGPDGVLRFDTRQILAVPRGKSYRGVERRLAPVEGGIKYEIVLTLGAEGPFYHVRGSLRRRVTPQFDEPNSIRERY
jgi:hypothetical protein